MASTIPGIDAAVDAFLRGAVDDLLAACAADVLLDVNVPAWRVQLRGHDALRHVLAEQEFLPGRTVTQWRATPTGDGQLLELETHAPVHGEPHLWRQIMWFRRSGDEVGEVVVYCTGHWDPATVARHAAEAPMVAP